MSESTVAKMNMDGIIEQVDEMDDPVGESLTTTDVDEARAWLAEQ